MKNTRTRSVGGTECVHHGHHAMLVETCFQGRDMLRSFMLHASLCRGQKFRLVRPDKGLRQLTDHSDRDVLCHSVLCSIHTPEILCQHVELVEVESLSTSHTHTQKLGASNSQNNQQPRSSEH